MATDYIRYDLLAQNALRSVVRQVLSDAARDGLRGDHHFFISFKTQHPDVHISDRLIEQFPEEITVVLQHQFWDLAVTETGFEVGMSFAGIAEKLVVPFEALTGFFDPSVQFGLKFEVMMNEDSIEGGEQSPDQSRKLPSTFPSRDPLDAEWNGADKKSKTQEETLNEPPDGKKPPQGQKIISLDTFRKRK